MYVYLYNNVAFTIGQIDWAIPPFCPPPYALWIFIWIIFPLVTVSLCRITTVEVCRYSYDVTTEEEEEEEEKDNEGGRGRGKEPAYQCMRPEIWVQSLGWEDPLEEGTTIHSSSFAWRIPRTKEPSRLQIIGFSKNWTQLKCLSKHANNNLKAEVGVSEGSLRRCTPFGKIK